MKTEPNRIATVESKTSQPVTGQPWAAVVEQVRQDAVDQSQRYLDETTVPHGGE